VDVSEPSRRTYWHLAAQQRMPTRYEVVSSRLLYYPDAGLSVSTPPLAFMMRHQLATPLGKLDWERFKDPRETTYAAYVSRQRDQEAHLARLLEGPEAPLPAAWLAQLARAFAPLRFVYHGLMMAASYAGSMAPGGRLTIALSLQAANELGRVQALARRLALLRERLPALGDDARLVFERDRAWQPLRRVLEQLLATYDFGEHLAALCLVVKPALDSLAFSTFAASAAEHGDRTTAELLGALAHESRWEREVAAALRDTALAEAPELRDTLRTWTLRWRRSVAAAVQEAEPLFGRGAEAALAAVDALARGLEAGEADRGA
jgi:toluene monooxygenase system protein E